MDVAGYRIENIGLDILIRHGYVHIPWFTMKLLDGNVGGNMLVALGEGPMSGVTYEIRAQASRINSAALANIRSW